MASRVKGEIAMKTVTLGLLLLTLARRSALQSRLVLLVSLIALAAMVQPTRAALHVVSSPDEAKAILSGQFSEDPCAVIVSRVPMRIGEPEHAPLVENAISFAFAGWDPTDEQLIGEFLSVLMPEVAERLGPPSHTYTVTIRYDSNSPYAGSFNSMTDEIVFRNTPAQVGTCSFFSTLAHELSHAWRDEVNIWAMCFEEGLARGAEVSIMSDTDIPVGYRNGYWDSGHSYYYDMVEQVGNSTEIIAPRGNFILSSLSLMRYQFAGWPWWRLQEASEGMFLREFHQDYFARCVQDPQLREHPESIRLIVRDHSPTVDGTPFDQWWGWYEILKTDIIVGDRVYVRPHHVGITAYRIDEWGNEIAYSGVLVEWEVFDRVGALLASGSLTTTSNGNAVPTVSLPGYYGKGTVLYRVHLPNGVVEKSQIYWLTPSMPFLMNGYGLYGVTEGPDGPISIISLDGQFQWSGTVANGEFRCNDLANVAGAYRICWNNRYCVVRKDTAAYLVVLDESTMEPVSVAGSPLPPAPLSLACAPNPFSTETHITIPGSPAEEAIIRIYDLTGRLVRTLAGRAVVEWNGTDNRARRLPAGIYFLRLDRGASPAKVIIE